MASPQNEEPNEEPRPDAVSTEKMIDWLLTLAKTMESTRLMAVGKRMQKLHSKIAQMQALVSEEE